MSDALSNSLFTRLRYTPLSDLARGRLTGRLNVTGRISAAPLPAPAIALLHRVVRHTRLWRKEKIQVAEELIAHFTDGLAAGATIDELLASFGDEAQSARLIRRAKRRNRPLLWHIVRYLGWFLVFLFAAYLLLGVYFLLGHPSPNINYVAELNRPTEQSSPDARAWPLYRRAILSMTERSTTDTSPWPKVTDSNIRGKNWPAFAAWIRQHSDGFNLLRQAAAKPTLGFALGAGGPAYDHELYPTLSPRVPSAGSPNTDNLLISLLLPYLNDVRHLANLLVADAKLAIESNDSPRLVQDLDALLNISHQVRADHTFIIDDLVALGLDNLNYEALEDALLNHAALLSDANLIQFAHRIAAPQVAADVVSLRGERMAFYDIVQRMYTDDGHGNGRMTLDGLRMFDLVASANSPSKPPLYLIPVGPASLLVVASRQDLLRQYDRLMDAGEAAMRSPMRQIDPDTFDHQVVQLTESPLNSARYFLLKLIVPALAHVQTTAERSLGRRDGIEVALALELYRRKTNQYPATLDALVPNFLPTIPADRITGEPVHYRLVDGKPLIYSVGADRKDDGGRPPNVGGEPSPNDAAQWAVPTEQVHAGDWVLYPQPPSPAPADLE